VFAGCGHVTGDGDKIEVVAQGDFSRRGDGGDVLGPEMNIGQMQDAAGQILSS
jgi:hypothetical protein